MKWRARSCSCCPMPLRSSPARRFPSTAGISRPSSAIVEINMSSQLAPDGRPSFFNPDVQQCPYALYKELREQAPVYWSEELGCFVVTPYALVSEVIRDTKTYSSLGTQDMIVNEEVADRIRAMRASGYPVVPFLATNDPPAH